ncbi:MAG: tRNA (adenosine(37)-N6)-threonylcarbamoyltransferase complex transferase subunit TsaD, partial [Spirochaetia bacterium]|nr:tRNA (adenosine(37)-N6)-threonylcarbamoyltransferase complex transferase subunit TsaD [Spirochaetia bacterium]
KIAKHLDLPYPGGPALDKLAQEGDENAVAYPLVMLDEKSYDFSYSGLKTAVLYSTQKLKRKDSPSRADIAASFQKAALSVLFKKAERACEEFQILDVGIAGGVSANSFLRKYVSSEKKIRYHFPPLSLCTDNAVMIAGLGHVMAERGLAETSPLALMPAARNSQAHLLV